MAIHLFVSLNIDNRFEASGIGIDANTTHPKTDPNSVTYIACPKVFHYAVSDAKTDEQKSHSDVHDGKSSRHVGDLG